MPWLADSPIGLNPTRTQGLTTAGTFRYMYVKRKVNRGRSRRNARFRAMNKVIPITEKRKVGTQGQGRASNADLRPREYLTEKECEALIKAAGGAGRHGYRDATLVLMLFTHGLRASEAANLQWSQVDLEDGLLHVRRTKGGKDSTHPLRGREIRALRKIARDYGGRHVFATERGGPMTVSGIQKMIRRAGENAGFAFSIHPHMLRHSCGFKLANEGRDTRAIQHYLGHKSINHTVRYTELAADRFDGFFAD